MNSRRRRRHDDGFHENFFSQLINSPVRIVSRWMEALSGGHRSGYEERGIGERILAVFTFPFRLLFAFAVFMVHAWTTSRNGYAFVRAMPAIMASLIVFALLWAISFRFEKIIAANNARYRRAVQDFPDNPDYAEMFAEKLVEFRPDDPLYKYNLGVSRERVGNLNSARRIMKQLAPDDATKDAPGYPAAQVWLGRDVAYTKDYKLADNLRNEQAINHYSRALNAEPNNIMALIGLSEIYQNQGDLTTASSYLESVVGQEWTVLAQLQVIPKLINMKQQLGEEELARRLLKSYIERISSISRKFPDVFQVWVILVQCATMLKDYDQAERIINEGYQTAKTAEVRENLVNLLASVQIMKADEIKSIEDQDSYQKRLFALCEAIKTNPRSREAYSRLIEFAAPDTLPEKKAEWLRESVIGCPNPAVIHVILGMQEIKRGDFVQGQKHWRIADQQFELSQYIVNNMIDLAITDKPKEFGNLLDMLTVAMELFPEQAALYQTRGLYYKNQGQFDEAIKDLSYAAEKMPTLISARTLLVQCYQAVGDQANALKVQLEIDKLVSKLDDAEKKLVEDFMRRSKERQEQEQKD